MSTHEQAIDTLQADIQRQEQAIETFQGDIQEQE
jgi:hypothetical protein